MTSTTDFKEYLLSELKAIESVELVKDEYIIHAKAEKIHDILYFLRSDEKYTLVAWRSEGGKANEGLIRMPLKELITQLDDAHFAQVHRSVVVNLRAVSHVTRGENETADIHLKGRADVLPVSRTYLHLFRQM